MSLLGFGMVTFALVLTGMLVLQDRQRSEQAALGITIALVLLIAVDDFLGGLPDGIFTPVALALIFAIFGTLIYDYSTRRAA